jgi:hypothetical protein
MQVVRHEAVGIDDDAAMGSEPVEAVENGLSESRIGEDRMTIFDTEGDRIDGIGVGVIEAMKATECRRAMPRGICHRGKRRRCGGSRIV